MKLDLQAVAALLQDDTSAIVTLESSEFDRPAKLDGSVYASYGARCTCQCQASTQLRGVILITLYCTVYASYLRACKVACMLLCFRAYRRLYIVLMRML